MKNFLPLILFFTIAEGQAQFASAQFDFNNFAWYQNTDGRMFYNAVNQTSGMEVPLNSGLSALFTSSLWIGGQNPAGNFVINAQTYCGDGCAYTPGPLTVDGTASSDPQTAAAFDRFWSVRQSDIDAHRAYYDCFNAPDCDVNVEFPDGYAIPDDFLTWPAEGDVNASYAANLAPFVDYNNDGVYNAQDGDYPAILGDFSTFFIFNGRNPASETSSSITGYEIHAMVYGFEAAQGALHNSLFVQYKVINRGTVTAANTYLGVFNDFDLGNPSDDRLGTDVARSTVYVYNGNETDSSTPFGPGYGDDLPVFGMRILGGPLRDSDGLDNPPLSPDYTTYGDQTTGWGDGIPDNERLGLSYAIGINNFGGGAPAATTDPQVRIEFYNYMKGIWKDGVSMIYGGSGYNPTSPAPLPAKYIYPGLSDPLHAGTYGNDPGFGNPDGWTEVTALIPEGDRRSLSSSGPFTFSPGDVQYLDVVYLFVRDSDFPGEDPLDSFLAYADDVLDTPWGAQLPDVLTSARSVKPEVLGFKLYPNPTRNAVTLESQLYNVGHYSIYDLLGKVVMQGNTAGSRTEISVGHLPKGLYLIRYEVDAEAAVQKLVVE